MMILSLKILKWPPLSMASDQNSEVRMFTIQLEGRSTCSDCWGYWRHGASKCQNDLHERWPFHVLQICKMMNIFLPRSRT